MQRLQNLLLLCFHGERKSNEITDKIANVAIKKTLQCMVRHKSEYINFCNYAVQFISISYICNHKGTYSVSRLIAEIIIYYDPVIRKNSKTAEKKFKGNNSSKC